MIEEEVDAMIEWWKANAITLCLTISGLCIIVGSSLVAGWLGWIVAGLVIGVFPLVEGKMYITMNKWRV